MIGWVAFVGKVGNVPGFAWGSKLCPVIVWYFSADEISPKHPWLPPPSSLGIDEVFLMSFFSTSFIE